MPFDQPGRQPAANAQPGLDAGHPPGVALVIIAKEVQQAVESQDTHFSTQRMARLRRLRTGHADPDDDVAQPALLIGPAPPKRRRRGGGKRQDVRRAILPPELFVERANALVGNESNRHASARRGGSDCGQPPGQARSPDATHRHDFDIETEPT